MEHELLIKKLLICKSGSLIDSQLIRGTKMIEVRYLYSACVLISTPDVRILCDPWFTQGIYDGSWFQYPKLNNPIAVIGPVDLIYISHIHPDHYDPVFLRSYLTSYPESQVIIGDYIKNYLMNKMKADGISHRLFTQQKFGETELKIFLHDNPDEIDSALGVKYHDHYVVNMNDNLYNPQQLKDVLTFKGNPDLALLSYTGAGPYPQTYYDLDNPVLLQKAKEKKELFFARYRQMKETLVPKKVIPFAGQYILGGHLAYLNPYRGVADAVEVCGFDPDAVVLADGGNAHINTLTLIPSAVRDSVYNQQEVIQFSESIQNLPMDYDLFFLGLPLEKIPLKRLLPSAYKRAHLRSGVNQDYYFCIKLSQNEWFVMNANKNTSVSVIATTLDNYLPRSEIMINLAYLYGLITCVFHWNNAEVGSQYCCRRVPDEFNRGIQSFLHFFHV